MQPIKIAFDTSAQWTTRNRNLIEFYSWNSMFAWILQGHIDKNTWNLEKTHFVSVLARKSLKWKKYVNKRDSVEKKNSKCVRIALIKYAREHCSVFKIYHYFHCMARIVKMLRATFYCFTACFCSESDSALQQVFNDMNGLFIRRVFKLLECLFT